MLKNPNAEAFGFFYVVIIFNARKYHINHNRYFRSKIIFAESKHVVVAGITSNTNFFQNNVLGLPFL